MNGAWEILFLNQINEILELNYQNEQFTIKQLIELNGMSRSQFYRKFRPLSDKPIKKYVRSFRLQKAHKLLTSTNLSITQVAFEVGFKDLSHFSHAFHIEFGIKPSDIKV